MCSRDILFFINTFVMTYDPDLSPKITTIPFITYNFQDIALNDLLASIMQKFDIVTEKSRRMGLTWLILAVYFWLWTFRPYLTFRLLSIKEDLVDKTDNSDCLFWKLLFILDQLPPFLKPVFSYNHLSILNIENNSSLIGLTTTSDSARAGRCTSMFPDEFATVPDGDGLEAATQSVTKSRIFNSTHKGAGTTFYRLTQKPSVKKLSLHWSLHPLYSRGLYYSKDGKLVLLDDTKSVVTVTREEYNFPEEYPFRLDGKLRSPWYDNECDRASHPMVIAQELDMDPFASDFQYFDGNMIQGIEKDDVRPPYLEGMLEFDADTLEPIEFVEGKNGPMKLWINLDAYGRLPGDLQVGAGHDISAGTGASNTAGSYVNLKTGEKIAEYTNPWAKPESYADIAVATAKWFNNAFMVWDGGGPGRTFGDTVIRTYRYVYYRRNEEGLTKKVSDKPGVFLNSKEKDALLGSYRRMLKDKVFIQRSSIANQGCLLFIFTLAGGIVHSSTVNSVDPSGAKAEHGDIVTADALAAKAVDLLGNKLLKVEKGEATCCWASRKAESERDRKAESGW